jgi:hypothetical protein
MEAARVAAMMRFFLMFNMAFSPDPAVSSSSHYEDFEFAGHR